MAEVVYRRFRPADQEPLWALYQTGVGMYDGIPIVGECYSWYLIQRLKPDGDMSNVEATYCGDFSRSGFWVAEYGKEIVGCVGAIPATSSKCETACTVELVRMIVAAEHRGRAIGRGLLQVFEQWAVEVGYRSIYLLTFKALDGPNALYTKCGYDVIEEEEVDMSDKVTSAHPAYVAVTHYIKHFTSTHT
jgi:GNAT superfamily N-acetyltransferase